MPPGHDSAGYPTRPGFRPFATAAAASGESRHGGRIVRAPSTHGRNRSDGGVHAAAKKPRPRYYAWADLMRRTFGYDVMACLHCGGRMKLLAMIDKPDAIERILSHLGLPTEPPRALPARAPPEQLDFFEADTPFEEPFEEHAVSP